MGERVFGISMTGEKIRLKNMKIGRPRQESSRIEKFGENGVRG